MSHTHLLTLPSRWFNFFRNGDKSLLDAGSLAIITRVIESNGLEFATFLYCEGEDYSFDRIDLDEFSPSDHEFSSADHDASSFGEPPGMCLSYVFSVPEAEVPSLDSQKEASRRDEFFQELHALLSKYNVKIASDCRGDTHGIHGYRTVIEAEYGEEWLVIDGWNLCLWDVPTPLIPG